MSITNKLHRTYKKHLMDYQQVLIIKQLILNNRSLLRLLFLLETMKWQIWILEWLLKLHLLKIQNISLCAYFKELWENIELINILELTWMPLADNIVPYTLTSECYQTFKFKKLSITLILIPPYLEVIFMEMKFSHTKCIIYHN